MHEFSVMQQVVSSILENTRDIPGIIGVEEIDLEIGELTFLGKEQLMFSFQVLSESQPLLKSARLLINIKPSLALCKECGYKGPLEHLESKVSHVVIPIFSCPMCQSSVEIIEGKDCAVSNVRATIDNGV